MYIEHHDRCAFIFLEGSTLPDDLISVCAARGMSAMALLDRDGLYGSPRFHLAAQKIRLQAHIGAEVSCESLREHKNLSSQRHPSTSLRAGSDTEKTLKIQKVSAFEESHNVFNDCHSEQS